MTLVETLKSLVGTKGTSDIESGVVVVRLSNAQVLHFKFTLTEINEDYLTLENEDEIRMIPLKGLVVRHFTYD